MSGDRFGLSTVEQAVTCPVFSCNWGIRGESAASLAERLRATVDVVRAVGGPFDQPWKVLNEEIGRALPPLPSEPSAWVDLVMTGYEKMLDGTPYVPGGSDVHLVTETSDEESNVNVTMRAGATENLSKNHVLVGGDLYREDYEAVWKVLDPETAYRVLGRLVSIWSPDSASFTTQDLMLEQHEEFSYDLPWVGCISGFSDAIWRAPRRLVGAEVERLGNGSLVTVGSRDQPSARLTDVMPVARDLHAAGLRKAAPSL